MSKLTTAGRSRTAKRGEYHHRLLAGVGLSRNACRTRKEIEMNAKRYILAACALIVVGCHPSSPATRDDVTRSLDLLESPYTPTSDRAAAGVRLAQLAPYSREVIPALIAILRRSSEISRRAADTMVSDKDTLYANDILWSTGCALMQVGKPAVPELLNVLKESDVHLARETATILGGIRDPRCLKGLEKAAESGDVELRCRAVKGIGSLGVPGSVAFLLTVLGDEHDLVRAYAAGAIGQVGSTDAAQALTAYVDDPSEIVRVNAAVSLYLLGYQREVQVQRLIEATKSNSSDIRSEAANALGDVGDSAAFSPLVAMLIEDRDPFVRGASAKALGKLGDIRAVPSLVSVLTQSARAEDQPMRYGAVLSLGRLKDYRAVDPLIELLSGDTLEIRMRAMMSLKEITAKEYGLDAARWKAWWNHERQHRKE